jgi:predicted metal-dependent hydrolase
MRTWGSNDDRWDHSLNMRNVAFAPTTIVFSAIAKRFIVRYTSRKGSGLELIQSSHSDLELNGNVGSRKGCLMLLRLWMQAQGRLYLVPWTRKISLETGLSVQTLQIRGQKTRWGSCSSKGTISLNYKLLFLPPHLVQYIIIHELCHTVHLNHSPNFWSFLATLEPACRALDAEMKGAGRLVPRWVNWGQ